MTEKFDLTSLISTSAAHLPECERKKAIVELGKIQMGMENETDTPSELALFVDRKFIKVINPFAR